MGRLIEDVLPPIQVQAEFVFSDSDSEPEFVSTHAKIYARFHSTDPLDRFGQMLNRTAFSGRDMYNQLIKMSRCMAYIRNGTDAEAIHYFSELKGAGTLFFSASPLKPKFEELLEAVRVGYVPTNTDHTFHLLAPPR